MSERHLNRRQFGKRAAGVFAAVSAAPATLFAANEPFRLRYIVASPMYGTTALAEILPEVDKCGASHIDIWPRRHANQREQVEQMGHEKFMALLDQYNVKLGISTRYDLGPYGLQDEIRFLKKFDGQVVVCGAKRVSGKTLRDRVKSFVESLKPHVAVAEKHGVAIGIENHANSLIDSPDSIAYFAEFAKSPQLGIALAPYHLPQDPQKIAKLIETLGESLAHFQAWEHGMGCHKKLPKEQELLQMPGRGSLDFVPILAALKRIDYRGFTEIFMHPVPRGIPILPSTAQVTAEINRSRAYLEACLKKV